MGCRNSTGLPFAIAQDPRPLLRQLVARGTDVGDLVADMVDPAAGIAGEKSGDRRRLAERVDELDLGVGQLDEDHGDAVLRLRQRRRHERTERLAIEPRRGIEVGHGDGDMIEAADHRFHSRTSWTSVTGFLSRRARKPRRTASRAASLMAASS